MSLALELHEVWFPGVWFLLELSYFGAQSPEMPTLFLQEMRNLGIKARVMGNEHIGSHGFLHAAAKRFLYEGVIMAEPRYSKENPEIKIFVEKHEAKFKDEVPNGIWTAEAYDAVKVMSKMIAECGMDVEKVRECLSKLKNYRGASRLISINENHDGVMEYVVKMVKDGKVVEVY